MKAAHPQVSHLLKAPASPLSLSLTLRKQQRNKESWQKSLQAEGQSQENAEFLTFLLKGARRTCSDTGGEPKGTGSAVGMMAQM